MAAPITQTNLGLPTNPSLSETHESQVGETTLRQRVHHAVSLEGFTGTPFQGGDIPTSLVATSPEMEAKKALSNNLDLDISKLANDVLCGAAVGETSSWLGSSEFIPPPPLMEVDSATKKAQ